MRRASPSPGCCSSTCVIEHWVLAPGTGSARATGRAAQISSTFGGRLRDAVITSVGVLANEYWLALVIGGGHRHRHPAHGGGCRRPVRVVLDAGCRGRGRRLGRHDRGGSPRSGISTVPGFLCAAPVAALGFFGERTRREQVLFVGAADRDPHRLGDRVGRWPCPSVGRPLPPSADRTARRPRCRAGPGASGRVRSWSRSWGLAPR